MVQPAGIPAQFTPPRSGTDSGGAFNVPTSIESGRTLPAYVSQSRAIRTVTSIVIKTREDFVEYLRKGGLDLVTSWMDFQTTKDFIASSYVVYTNHGNMKEPLAEFLIRYPDLKPQVELIRDTLKSQLV